MRIELSQKQMDRIKYEAMLMKMSIEQLYVVAPHIFNEGITAANTVSEEEITSQNTLKDLKESLEESIKSSDEYHSFY